LKSLPDPVWLVMGGGALKGLAHLGVWRALEESGIRIAGIVGTSIGAIVGAGLAAGRPVGEIEAGARGLERKDALRPKLRVFLPFGVRQSSAFRGETLERLVRRFAGDVSWDDLVIPFATNCVDLETGETVWFGHGGDRGLTVAEAIYASSALPILYPPLERRGRYYVDGGLRDTLPIDRARELGAASIIAVNAGAGPEADPEAVLRHGLIGLNQRMFVIMSEQRRRDVLARETEVPLLLIRPRLDGEGGFDFERVGYFIEEGHRATLETLRLLGR
jgi:NTE family protein